MDHSLQLVQRRLVAVVAQPRLQAVVLLRGRLFQPLQLEDLRVAQNVQVVRALARTLGQESADELDDRGVQLERLELVGPEVVSADVGYAVQVGFW